MRICRSAGTADATHNVRIVSMEKSVSCGSPGYGQDVIRWALRKHMIPEVYIQWIRMIYREVTYQVQTAAGRSKPFTHKDRRTSGIGAPSPLIITVMDAVTGSLERQPPWALLYADDVVLMAENRK
ncbi:unnamed protein product [Strongylus vulgaris]|uniref:Reverse transcriptase domain-containing protein n=1 Tax=Strongylus vulgaris TaxID=40348 RepID=A0A3P7L810_STRVU|nr:unnamed protein product [Strongylus vulgaris]